MRRTPVFALAFVLGSSLLGAGCSDSGRPAEVMLTIDGKAYDYKTEHAELDRREAGGPYSVYFLRGQAEAPYLVLRHYSGNPVAQLGVRYTKPGAREDEPAKYDCYVPGTLSDGRQTLGWTKDDGEERHRSETGEGTCQATLKQEGDVLTLEFDATLIRSRSMKKGRSKRATTEIDPTDQIRARGSATLKGVRP